MATITAPDTTGATSYASEVKEVSPQADLAIKERTSSVLQYVQVYQQNNGAGLALQVAGTSQAIFVIPGDQAYNLAKSYLEFNLTFPAAAALTNVLADLPPIDSISLLTQSGSTQLANVQNAHIYGKNAIAMNTSLERYYNSSSVYGGVTPAAGFFSLNECCNPSGVAADLAAHDGPAPTQLYPRVAGLSAAAIDDNSGVDRSVFAKQRVISSGPAAVLQIPYRLRLGDLFPGTMLALNKTILTGSNLQLIINFSALNKVSFRSAAALAAPYVAVAGGALTGLFLNMAKECNADIVDGLRSSLMAGGYELNIPYVNSNQFSGNAGRWAANTSLVAGMGNYLKRLVNIPVNAVDVLENSSGQNNVNGVLYTGIQSFLDSSPLQQKEQQCGTNIDDYRYQLNQLETTPAAQTVREFQIDSVWVDNFSDTANKSTHWPEDDTKDSGLKIGSIQKNYNIQFNAAANMKLYQYAVWVRRLRITPSGLMWA